MKLTLGQKDIYFEQLLYPDEPIYNIGARISIKGTLDKEVFRQAYNALIEQHDAFRSKVHGDVTDLKMCTIKEIRPLEFIECLNGEDKKKLAIELMQKEFKKPFDIVNDKYLYRFILITIDSDFYYLFSVYHHIITDGWGTSLMFTRLVQNYNEIIKYGIITSQYPFYFKDFIDDEEKYLHSKEFNKDKQYWLDKFKTIPDNLFRKIDISKTINKSSRRQLSLGREVYDKLIDLAVVYNVSTFHMIVAIFYIYIGRTSLNNLLTIGLPVLNRSGINFKKTVGLFMGVCPLLIEIDEDESFIELVKKIKSQLRQDYRHQRFPLGQLIKELKAFNQQESILNVTLSYEKQDYSNHFKDTVTKVVPLSHESERVALALYIREFDKTENVIIDFDYNLNYFSESSIERVINHFEMLLQNILIQSDRKIKNIDYLTKDEREELLFDFNATTVDYPMDKTFVDIFEEQVERNPYRIAVRDSKLTLTYAKLKEKSDQVASYLVSKYGLGNEPIGVLVERSAELIILLLGILKSGKCYIPIDPILPKERISYIIKHSCSPLIISENQIIQKFLLSEDSQLNTIQFLAKENLFDHTFIEPLKILTKLTPASTAYVIYTSGSTGDPKGVAIGHKSLLNFLFSIQSKPGIQEDDLLYSITTYAFDISLLEFFTPLIVGASVFIADKETLLDVEKLKDDLTNFSPTIIQGTPSFYQMLFNSGWRGDKGLKVLCGGDSLNKELSGLLVTHSKEVWHLYGPTETTVWSSIKKLEKPSDSCNIGSPINNTQIYIVDKYMNLLPIDAIGRIFISGDGLAQGYYNNSLLTAERFIANPFVPGTKMYETGDLGRRRETGEIDFFGRDDFQVKIRGFRIELEEIEIKLLSIQGIEQVVVASKEFHGEQLLVVYYTLVKGSKNGKTELREFLQDKLPEYMIPSFFVELESIPLTPNGKIDRKRLPDIVGENLIRKEYIAPRNEMELRLVEIWQEVLNIDKVGITDNFFELGGHSLLAGKIANLISIRLNTEISLKQIFTSQTIKNLIKIVGDEMKDKNNIAKAEIKKNYRLTPEQMKIWIASNQEGGNEAYNLYALFHIQGEMDYQLMDRAFQSIIADNEILRTNFIEKNGNVYQLIKERIFEGIEEFNVVDEVFLSLVKSYVTQRFNLETDLLIKLRVFNLVNGEKYLCFLTHHLVVDGSSLNLILKELKEIYTNSKENVLSKKIQFKDYSEWLLKQNNEIKIHLKKYNKTSVFSSCTKEMTGYVKYKSFQLSYDQLNKIKRFSNLNKITIFTFVSTALNVVLMKITKNNFISCGVVFNGRNLKELETSIGMFIKTLPLQVLINEEDSIEGLVHMVMNQLIELNQNFDLTFPYSLNELTDFLLVYQHTAAVSRHEVIDFKSFSLVKEKLYFTHSRVPVVFNFFESDHLICELEYNEHVDESFLDLIWNKFLLLIDWVDNNSNKTMKEIDLSTDKEKQMKNRINIEFEF